MKLTLGSQKTISPKIKNQNCKHIKAEKTLLYKKAPLKMLVKFSPGLAK